MTILTILTTTHVLAVPNLAVSSAFYRDVLGFEVREMGDPGWRLYVKDACRIMAGECPTALPPRETGDHAYVIYLTVDDVDAWHARIASTATEILKPPRDEPWGMRELGLRTADGHRIMLAQRLP